MPRAHTTPIRRRAATLLAAAALLALAASGPAGAQGYFGRNKVQYQPFDWHIYKSPHFDVYYYPEEEAYLEQMVSYAESAYLYLSKAFDHEPKYRVPLIYYRTHAEFEQTNVGDVVSEAELAFAEPFEHRVLLSIDHPPDKLYQVLTHEMTHIFEFSILYQDSFGRIIRGRAPQWLMEGLASHMGKDEDSLDRMIIRDAVIHGVVPPISKVQGINFLIYRYGRAAFDFIETKWGAEGIRNFLVEFRKVLLTGNIEKAVKEAFGVEADEFDRLFQRYLRQKYLPTLLEKGEPEDYGKQIGFKLPGVMTFSPVLSPSGDLVAVLTNRYYDIDVVILQAKDGEVIKNLTKGFTNEYEFISTEVFEGKTDLAWSPDGDLLAFFVRKENRRRLLIINALTGHEVRNIEIEPVDPASPAFSPDGKKILFAGNLGGVVDIFELDLESGHMRNMTDDEYYDANPSYSSDGKTMLYNRRVDAWWKVFTLDVEDPTRKTQLTFGQSSEITPSFSRDGTKIYYCSDVSSDIFNVYSLDLDSGEVRQFTDVGGGYMSPQDRPAERGKSKAVATSYYGGRFALYEVDTTKPLKVITPAERAGEVGEMKPFEPPLKLTVDQSEKQPYVKHKFHVEDASPIGIGVVSDGTVIGSGAVSFADLLGGRRFWFNVFSVANYETYDLGYVNLETRLQHYYRYNYYSDFLVLPSASGFFTRIRGNVDSTLSTGFFLPLSSHYRIEGIIGATSRDIISPQIGELLDPNRPPKRDEFGVFTGDRVRGSLAEVGVAFVGDTLRYNPWGPWHGKRFRIAATTSPLASGSDPASFTNYEFDYRSYTKLTYRSLFAWRVGSLLSDGRGATLFGIGGYNQIRGYRYREFIGDQAVWTNFELRFPLVDRVQWPWGGALRWIRGVLFFDAGAAWTQDGRFFDRELAKPTPVALINSTGLFRDFKFYDSSQHALRDARASYGIGLNVRLGVFDLNWAFAKQLPYGIVDLNGPSGMVGKTCRQSLATTIVRDPMPPHGIISFDRAQVPVLLSQCGFTTTPTTNWKSEFYIGYEF
ncbi:MAG: PD40 domain-containing protein [Acidobacteria bacterium]|nr:PD40 domain-containing protein [Acidobacteriota bacterium]